MRCMFYGCEKFNQPVDFDTRNVTENLFKMGNMFCHCKSLQKENIMIKEYKQQK